MVQDISNHFMYLGHGQRNVIKSRHAGDYLLILLFNVNHSLENKLKTDVTLRKVEMLRRKIGLGLEKK